MIKKIVLSLFFLIACIISEGQSFQFAHISDTHIGNATGEEDLTRTVNDINANPAIRFVIISGDITEFGSDEELTIAKRVLDNLNKPWYIIPGNHDANWSESGGNSFRKIFGAETFHFTYEGYNFLGTHCGPNMRMSPGQVPRENIYWLDTTLQKIPADQPIIFVNHYPLDTSLNNWYEIADRLKTKNTQLYLLGHGHNNRRYNFEGIPGIMGRSNLRAKQPIGGYNIVTLHPGDKVIYQEKNPGQPVKDSWAQVALKRIDYSKDTTQWYRPSYAVNEQYQQVKQVWSYQDNSDIGNGAANWKNLVITANTNGKVYALNMSTGKKAWQFNTEGKIYSTPAVSGDRVILGSTDNNIYCLNAKNGTLVWKIATEKAVLGSPVIHKQTVYIGASDGIFRALDVNTGKTVWQYNEVDGFVVTKPLIYKDNIYFGTWNRQFYALNHQSGNLVWQWDNGHGSRMFSPAACHPVAANDRIFIVAPDRYMTSFNAATGEVIWRKADPAIRVRESMGVAKDGSMIFAKTMEGDLYAFSPRTDSMHVLMKTPLNLGYELAPSAIVENNGIILVPSHDGDISAVEKQSGKLVWKHKISNCLVNQILPINDHSLVATTMDGKVVYLKY